MLGFRRSAAPPTPVSAPVEPVLTRSTVPIVRRSRPGMRMARQFDAGQTDRLTAAWPTFPLPADDIVRRHQRVLVARSREQAANNDFGKAFLRLVRQNIVGPQGVRLQAQARDDGGSLDAAGNDALEAAFREWGAARNCDVSGRQSWRMMQAMAVTTAAKDGEFFFRKIFGADAGPWGFALQALDPQRCPVDYDVDRLRDGRFIRHGIEFNRYGRPLAYYFTTTDETQAEYFYGGRALGRIPAAEIIHGFLPELVGQKRGLPWMATSLWRMNMLSGYEKAALVNARISAAKGGFFKWQEGYGPASDGDDDDNAPLTMEVEPGIWTELPEGVDPVPNHPPYPVGEMSPFRKDMLRGISSGLGVAYNNFANDLEGVNFSSIRQGALDEREHWKEMQEWLIETLIEPVFEEWLRIALLRGRVVTAAGAVIPASRLSKFRAVVWQPRRWQWIDPRADVQAAVDMKNNLMGSFGQYIRDQGRDPQTVWREIAQDIQQMRDAGIPEDYIKQAMGRKLAPPPQGEADPARGQNEGNSA